MKITAYLNTNCRCSSDVWAILNKYNLHCEEHVVAKISDAHVKTTRSSSEQPPLQVEIDGTRLTNVSSEAVEKYLLEKVFVESVDKKPEEALHADEEQEAIRTKTVRFF